MEFTRGQKSKLSALTPAHQVEIGIGLTGPAGETYTVLALVLGADQKVLGPGAIAGAHQPSAADGAVTWQSGQGSETATITVDLGRLPAGSQRVAVVAAGSAQPFSTLTSGAARLSGGGTEAMRYPFGGADFAEERAILVVELYFKDEWRVTAAGRGWNDGMTGLLAAYGAPPIPAAPPPGPPPAAPPGPPPAAPPGPPPAAPPPVGPPPAAPPPAAPPGPPPSAPPPAGPPPAAPPPAGPSPAAPPPAAPPGPPPSAPPPVGPPPAAPPPAAPPPAGPSPAGPPPAAPPPAAPPPAGPAPAGAPPPPAAAAAAGAPPAVNLGKVTLEKQGESRSVNLEKGAESRPIHINLNWQQGTGKRRGFLSGRSSAPDLDVGCMFELKDGTKSVIQPLGGNFGSPHGPPWIHLDKDDRSGAAADGENLYLMRPEFISRVMVFALIYEGAADFRSVGGYMTMVDQSGSQTQIILDNPDANRPFCAVALITTQGDQVVIQKEERYFRGHRDADSYYAFGFSWTPGSKD